MSIMMQIKKTFFVVFDQQMAVIIFVLLERIDMNKVTVILFRRQNNFSRM